VSKLEQHESAFPWQVAFDQPAAIEVDFRMPCSSNPETTMQSNRAACVWAAFLVVSAVVLQLFAWWMIWDDITFGPRGTGTQVIADMFGKNTFPATVAMKLEYIVRGAILLAVGLLAFGSIAPSPTRRYGKGRRAMSLPCEIE
jgi:hypothetical protein